MWYVVQTAVGHENQIAEKLNGFYSKDAKKPCFVLSKERTWRREGIYQVGVEPMFPGYIFVDTDEPVRLKANIDGLTGSARLLIGGQAIALEEPEEKFFKKLLREDTQYTIRRFQVEANEAGEIVSAEGILGECLERIVRKRLRKRVVTLEIPFLGQMRHVELSIRIEGDLEKTMKEEKL